MKEFLCLPLLFLLLNCSQNQKSGEFSQTEERKKDTTSKVVEESIPTPITIDSSYVARFYESNKFHVKTSEFDTSSFSRFYSVNNTDIRITEEIVDNRIFDTLYISNQLFILKGGLEKLVAKPEYFGFYSFGSGKLFFEWFTQIASGDSLITSNKSISADSINVYGIIHVNPDQIHYYDESSKKIKIIGWSGDLIKESEPFPLTSEEYRGSQIIGNKLYIQFYMWQGGDFNPIFFVCDMTSSYKIMEQVKIPDALNKTQLFGSGFNPDFLDVKNEFTGDIINEYPEAYDWSKFSPHHLIFANLSLTEIHETLLIKKSVGYRIDNGILTSYFFRINDSTTYLIEKQIDWRIEALLASIKNKETLKTYDVKGLNTHQLLELTYFILAKNGYSFLDEPQIRDYYSIYPFYTEMELSDDLFMNFSLTDYQNLKMISEQIR